MLRKRDFKQLNLYIFSTHHFGVPNNASTPHQAQFMNIGTGNEEEGCANEMLFDDGDDDVESGM